MRRIATLAVLVVGVAGLPLGATGPAAALEVGDKVPDFTLPATIQETVSMHDYLGKKNVLLVRFIGAFTPTSTTEVAAVDRDPPNFDSQTTQVLRISSDFPLEHNPAPC